MQRSNFESVGYVMFFSRTASETVSDNIFASRSAPTRLRHFTKAVGAVARHPAEAVWWVLTQNEPSEGLSLECAPPSERSSCPFAGEEMSGTGPTRRKFRRMVLTATLSEMRFVESLWRRNSPRPSFDA